MLQKLYSQKRNKGRKQRWKKSADSNFSSINKLFLKVDAAELIVNSAAVTNTNSIATSKY